MEQNNKEEIKIPQPKNLAPSLVEDGDKAIISAKFVAELVKNVSEGDFSEIKSDFIAKVDKAINANQFIEILENELIFRKTLVLLRRERNRIEQLAAL